MAWAFFLINSFYRINMTFAEKMRSALIIVDNLTIYYYIYTKATIPT